MRRMRSRADEALDNERPVLPVVLMHGTAGFVVFGSRGNFHRQWTQACRGAGVPGKVVRDLRRTAVPNLVAEFGLMNGVDFRSEPAPSTYSITQLLRRDVRAVEGARLEIV